MQFFIFQLIFSSFSLGNIFAETVELKISKEDVIMTAFRKLGEQSTINKLFDSYFVMLMSLCENGKNLKEMMHANIQRLCKKLRAEDQTV